MSKKLSSFQKGLCVFINLILLMLMYSFWLVYNETDIHITLLENTLPNNGLYHQSDQNQQSDENYSCDKGYNLCTNNPQDIITYLYNTNIECIDYEITHKPLLFSHIQGIWSDLGQTFYLNVTKSKSFKLHRLYYDNLFIDKLPTHYYVLMNKKLLCDGIYSRNVNHTFQSKAKDLLSFQCDINIQTKQHVNITINENEVLKWYADNDNYIDIITTTNVIISGAGRTDFWNNCTNEYYQPRERCAQFGYDYEHKKETSLHPLYMKDFNSEYRDMNIDATYKYVINIAESHGYFHFLVEEVPRLSGFVYLLKNLASTNYSKYPLIDIIYINVAWSGWHFLQFIFRKEIEKGTIGVIEHGKTDRSNIFAYNLIQPHASPCLFARRYGSMLLNQIIRKEIEIYTNEKKIDLQHENTINIVMIKRKHHRRWIKNFDDLKHRIVNEFINSNNSNKYNLYIHDDLKLKEIDAIDYYIQFYKADIVLGAFGAGLTNIVWCKPGTAVIMMEGTNGKNHRMYMHHSTALGMRYYGYLHTRNWNVNVDEIIKIIKLYI
eukprot:56228_1